MKRSFTLGKDERIKSRKQIEQLFSRGKSFAVNPYKICYLIQEMKPGLQFGIGVSAKNFKSAVDRNRIKRLTKEAYRLQKLSLQEKVKQLNKAVTIFFVYTGKELPDFILAKEKVAVVLKKLELIIDETVSPNS